MVNSDEVPTPSPGIMPFPAPVLVLMSSISTPNCSAEHSSLIVYHASAHCTFEDAFTPTERSSYSSRSPVTARSWVTVPPAEFPHTAKRSGSRFSLSALALRYRIAAFPSISCAGQSASCTRRYSTVATAYPCVTGRHIDLM